MGLRTVHNRHADELARLLDPNRIREAAIGTRRAVIESAFSSGIGEALDGFFANARERLQSAIATIEEAKKMMANVSRNLAEYRSSAAAGRRTSRPSGSWWRSAAWRSVARAISAARRACILHRRKTLGALFFDTVALKVVHVFEIADREVRTWMNGFMRPLEAQMNAFQEQTNNAHRGDGTHPERRDRPGRAAGRAEEASWPTSPRSASSWRRTTSGCRPSSRSPDRSLA